MTEDDSTRLRPRAGPSEPGTPLSPDNPAWPALVFVVVAATLAIDVFVSGMFVGGVIPYFLAVLACVWIGDRRTLATVAVVSGLAMAVGTAVKTGVADMFYVNRAVLTAALLVAGVLGWRALTSRERQVAEKDRDLARGAEHEAELTARIAQLEAHALAAVEAADVGLWEYRVHEDREIVTPKLERMLGLAPGERIQTFADWARRVDAEGASRQKALIDDFVAGRNDGRFTSEYHVEHSNGARRYFMTRALPRLDAAGKPLSLIGADVDITEMRQLTDDLTRARDAAEAANRAKSDFLANVSHELRTPLNAIMGFSDMMASEALGPMQNETYKTYSRDILGAGQHLLDIINDILDLSRIESGEVTVSPDIVAPADVVETVLSLVTDRAARAGLTLNTDLADRGLVVRCDPRHLRQIVLNLLSNAVKFTEAGGTVSIAVRRSDDGGTEIEVCDTGIGIDEEDIQRVFEPFQQIGDPHVRRGQGSGLGLSITRSLVALNDGKLGIESRPGKGTRVVVALPSI